YAAWDLGFHAVALGVVDLEFAKQQVALMLSESYLHPNGQIPAYEWNFNDVNPPVHAWATLFLYNIEKAVRGHGDVEFLSHAYEHMALKFVEHFLWIAAAMNRVGGRHDRLWDETDGFFYDQLRLPDGRAVRLKVRSLVGLLPLCAATVIEADLIARFPSVVERV